MDDKVTRADDCDCANRENKERGWHDQWRSDPEQRQNRRETQTRERQTEAHGRVHLYQTLLIGARPRTLKEADNWSNH